MYSTAFWCLFVILLFFWTLLPLSQNEVPGDEVAGPCCLFEGAHGIHCTKTARFLRTSDKDYFVRDRNLLWAYLLFSSTSSFFLLDSYRMTRKYLFFEFNNFFSDQWLVFYGIFRLHVTCTIKTQQNYELQILHAIYIATFFLPWNDILPVFHSLKSLSSQKEIIYTDYNIQRGLRSADSLN